MSKSTAFTALANPHLNQVKPYVPGLTIGEAVERYHIPPDKVIKLSSNENPIGPPPLAMQFARKMLDELHRYPDSKALALRSEIAAKEGLSPENVIIGAGSSEIMSFIIRAFSKPGDEIISMDPSFTVYAELATADGRRPVFVALDFPFELDLKKLDAALSEKTRVLFITRPNNPTSRLIPLSTLKAIAKMVPKAVVVSDEAYIEFAVDYARQTAVDLIDNAENVIVTRTFSKAYGIPNLRVGYALGPTDAIDFLFRIKPKWNVGEIAQQAAIGALKDDEHLKKVLAVVGEGRRYLSNRLAEIPGLDVVPESQGNFIMVKVGGTGFSAETFTDELGARGFIIRGDFHPDYVRISIGIADQNKALVEAIEKTLSGQ
jgi:histidinol-phosphate aminotransferase